MIKSSIGSMEDLVEGFNEFNRLMGSISSGVQDVKLAQGFN